MQMMQRPGFWMQEELVTLQKLIAAQNLDEIKRLFARLGWINIFATLPNISTGPCVTAFILVAIANEDIYKYFTSLATYQAAGMSLTQAEFNRALIYKIATQFALCKTQVIALLKKIFDSCDESELEHYRANRSIAISAEEWSALFPRAKRRAETELVEAQPKVAALEAPASEDSHRREEGVLFSSPPPPRAPSLIATAAPLQFVASSAPPVMRQPTVSLDVETQLRHIMPQVSRAIQDALMDEAQQAPSLARIKSLLLPHMSSINCTAESWTWFMGENNVVTLAQILTQDAVADLAFFTNLNAIITQFLNQKRIPVPNVYAERLQAQQQQQQMQPQMQQIVALQQLRQQQQLQQQLEQQMQQAFQQWPPQSGAVIPPAASTLAATRPATTAVATTATRPATTIIATTATGPTTTTTAAVTATRGRGRARRGGAMLQPSAPPPAMPIIAANPPAAIPAVRQPAAAVPAILQGPVVVNFTFVQLHTALSDVAATLLKYNENNLHAITGPLQAVLLQCKNLARYLAQANIQEVFNNLKEFQFSYVLTEPANRLEALLGNFNLSVIPRCQDLVYQLGENLTMIMRSCYNFFDEMMRNLVLEKNQILAIRESDEEKIARVDNFCRNQVDENQMLRGFKRRVVEANISLPFFTDCGSLFVGLSEVQIYLNQILVSGRQLQTKVDLLNKLETKCQNYHQALSKLLSVSRPMETQTDDVADSALSPSMS